MGDRKKNSMRSNTGRASSVSHSRNSENMHRKEILLRSKRPPKDTSLRCAIYGKGNALSLVLVNYKDRFTRFDYRYIKTYLSEFGVKVQSLHKLDEKTLESEMVEDLVAIISSFSGKLYGLRSNKNKKNSLGNS